MAKAEFSSAWWYSFFALVSPKGSLRVALSRSDVMGADVTWSPRPDSWRKSWFSRAALWSVQTVTPQPVSLAFAAHARMLASAAGFILPPTQTKWSRLGTSTASPDPPPITKRRSPPCAAGDALGWKSPWCCCSGSTGASAR